MVTLTDSNAARKVEAPEETEEPASTPKPRFTVEEKLTKAFAGLCGYRELLNLACNDVITMKEIEQLCAEHKYIGEDPPGLRTETKK